MWVRISHDDGSREVVNEDFVRLRISSYYIDVEKAFDLAKCPDGIPLRTPFATYKWVED